ncbi:unnamed protein product [Mytilus edulis]|uniref:Mab-21-like HhH/H2TH-like domain-containing protein n=1 Tax=Mytilus edulis TaxID=6550 RepID=A0A8S3UW18_MYTED|nr:unnamed protein product [Mytilus edulis]
MYAHNATGGYSGVSKKDGKILCDVNSFNIPIKPIWPYKEVTFPYSSNAKKNFQHKCDSFNSIPHKTNSIEFHLDIHCILRRLVYTSQEIVEVGAEDGSFVQQSVKSFMLHSLDELQAKYLMFKNCFSLEVDSPAEGTMIMESSELDYLIALPELSNEKNCQLYFTEAILTMVLQDDLRKEMQSWIKENQTEERIPDLDSLRPFSFLRGALELAFKSNLPDGMSFLTENKKHEISRTSKRGQAGSFMFHFAIERTGRRKLFVSVDVCFSVPLDTQRIEQIVVQSSIDATYLKHIYDMCSERSPLVCAVMNSSTDICVLSDRYQHVNYVKVTKFSEHVDAKKCYKTAKYFMKLFLPQYAEDGCSICSKSIIPSYAIKTIIFYMIEFYTHPYDWNEVNLGNRLVEVFEILLYSQFTLMDHTCYLWRKIEIPNLCGPFAIVPSIEKAFDFLATVDWQILRKVSAYWQLMRTEIDSKELIKQFLNLLKYLRDSDERHTIIYSRTGSRIRQWRMN